MGNNAIIELVEVMRNDPKHTYDHIAMHYHEMSKSELADIIKELVYTVMHNVSKPEYNIILGETANELEDQYAWRINAI